MNIRNVVRSNISTRLEVKTTDPDIKRRGGLLNILLLGTFILMGVAVIVTMITRLTGAATTEQALAIFIPAMIFASVMGVLLFVNNYVSSTIAAIVFLVVLTAILYQSNTPYEAVWGRNMIMLALPVIMASVVLNPQSSFLVAFFVGITFIVVSSQNDFPPNYIGIIAYFAIALVSWLSASTLEKTLHELRVINADLDAKVEERTQDLRLANTQLRDARDKAIAASRYKTELTARVSHELRTPLGAILGFAEMLRKGIYGTTTERQREKLDSIIDTTTHLSEMINAWLDQARLESGKLELTYEMFDIRRFMKEIENVSRVLAERKNLSLYFIVSPQIPVQFYADKMRLNQILINLIGNAIKYTERGNVKVTVLHVDDSMSFQVQDTGIGIASSELATIFDSFVQVDGTRTRKHEGFGLGLSIVKQLVDLMGGEIQVHSELNKGSTFTVQLPMENGLQPETTSGELIA